MFQLLCTFIFLMSPVMARSSEQQNPTKSPGIGAPLPISKLPSLVALLTKNRLEQEIQNVENNTSLTQDQKQEKLTALHKQLADLPPIEHTPLRSAPDLRIATPEEEARIYGDINWDNLFGSPTDETKKQKE